MNNIDKIMYISQTECDLILVNRPPVKITGSSIVELLAWLFTDTKLNYIEFTQITKVAFEDTQIE